MMPINNFPIFHFKKLAEIKRELTAQHQEHIRDIQQNMEKESNVLLDQLKAEHGHQVEALEERHQHELEEAVLRVNRDLMAAHAEEITKIQEDHGRQLERLMTATPTSVSFSSAGGGFPSFKFLWI